MRRVALVSVILLSAGCATTDPALECGDDMTHPFESRCVENVAAPHNEVCTVWLGDGAEKDQSIFCQASTDGHATAHVDFTGSGDLTVYVRGVDNELLTSRTVGPGQAAIGVDDEPGRWRLVVDFSEATGPARVQFWG